MIMKSLVWRINLKEFSSNLSWPIANSLFSRCPCEKRYRLEGKESRIMHKLSLLSIAGWNILAGHKTYSAKLDQKLEAICGNDKV